MWLLESFILKSDNLWFKNTAYCTLLNQVLFVCACVFFTSEEDNLQGWFFAEDDGNQIKKQKHPLLLRQMPVVMSKLQEFKVRHFPVLLMSQLDMLKQSFQAG